MKRAGLGVEEGCRIEDEEKGVKFQKQLFPTDLSPLAASFYFAQFRLGVLFMVIGMRVRIVLGGGVATS